MAKATALSPELMNTEAAPVATVTPRAATAAAKKKAAQVQKIVPLQIRIPANEAKSIKHAALEADQTISDYILACCHAFTRR